jgi:tRNA modification GTPase
MSAKVQDHDTIAAIATAPGRGAIGIIRISGPDALEVAGRLFKGDRNPADMPGFSLARGWIEHDGERLDEVLALVMRAPRSYTREDVVEFHCHGGAVPLKRVLAAVIGEGARPAAPGEFTKRAFLSGRMDLAQAEAVADIIAGETEAAARAAAVQLAGELSKRLRKIRRVLVEILARLEAGIDFSDEEDVVAIEPEEFMERLERAGAGLAELIDQAGRGARLRDGARVVIAGRPNVGKSTLMNRLLRSERVIVTESPGATRDVVEDLIEIEGIPVRLFDTAGIREQAKEIEMMGVEKARATLENADLVLLLVDGSEPLSDDDRELANSTSPALILVINKCDLETVVEEGKVKELATGAPVLKMSALTGEGVEDLERAIARALIGGEASMETPAVTNARHADVLRRAGEAIKRAMSAREEGLSDEFAASDLRLGLDALGEITGETATDEILDIIFSRFCIGK